MSRVEAGMVRRDDILTVTSLILAQAICIFVSFGRSGMRFARKKWPVEGCLFRSTGHTREKIAAPGNTAPLPAALQGERERRSIQVG